MHDYLRAIGFNIETKKELKKLLNDVRNEYNHQRIVSYKNGSDYCELQKFYGQNIGIALCGELDENENFEPDYYFPYYMGSGITTQTEVIVDKRIEKEEYIGICEDPRVGISLIFHLQNGVEFMHEKKTGHDAEIFRPITFSGLALSGKILLPVAKSQKQLQTAGLGYDNRKILLNAARDGDQSAIESLTLDDIDLYSQVSRRTADEDIFTIVDTYFMPYGIECDLYSIMGEIIAVRRRENILTKRPLYQLKLDVNELKFDICVPAEQVMGEPEIGRRFKGTIWLQGYIDFGENQYSKI